MSFNFTLAKISKLGDADEKYGQRWWGEVQEDLKPISFNVMSGEFKAGDHITCEESINRRSTKGVDYLQLKKVHLVGSVDGAQQSIPQDDRSTPVVLETLQRIEKKLDKLLGDGETFD